MFDKKLTFDFNQIVVTKMSQNFIFESIFVKHTSNLTHSCRKLSMQDNF